MYKYTSVTSHLGHYLSEDIYNYELLVDNDQIISYGKYFISDFYLIQKQSYVSYKNALYLIMWRHMYHLTTPWVSKYPSYDNLIIARYNIDAFPSLKSI